MTPAGLEIRARLLAARERALRSLVDDWQPEDPEVDAMIHRLSEELAHHETVPT